MSDDHAKRSKWHFILAVLGMVCLAIPLVMGLLYVQRYQRLQSDPVKPEPGFFDLSNSIVPVAEVLSGGPPKDGIPALTSPRVVSANRASYLADDDRVIGIVLGGKARAYPLKLLNLHEIVNDEFGGRAVAVTYCPLCDSAAAFDRDDGDQRREFGVSGLLYNSNVLMYDRSNVKESLWSQMMKKGISGPQAETSLPTLPVELTAWLDWKSRYPATKVLSDKTGHPLSYDFNPYGDYFRTDKLWFPVNLQSDRLPAKTPVLGVWTEQAVRAYPLTAFSKQRTLVEDELDGHSLRLRYNPNFDSLRVEHADDGVNWVYSLWFAWYAFHPQTDVYGVPDDQGEVEASEL